MCRTLDAAKSVDRFDVPRPFFLISYPETGCGGKAQNADFALVGVAMNLTGRLASLIQWEGLGQSRVDAAEINQPIGLPCLPIICEVATDNPFE